MNSIFKIGLIFLIIGLSSCTAFYSRHYTKGFYHEAFAKKPSVDQLHVTIKQKRDPIPKDTLEEKRTITVQTVDESNDARKKLIEQHHFQKPGKKDLLFHKKAIRKPAVLAKRSFQKTLKSGSSGDSPIGKALLYILAIILALAIIALAIYFLPAILIPAPVSAAFETLVTIAIIIVLVVFVFLIYSLFLLLINLFKQKKAVPEEDF